MTLLAKIDVVYQSASQLQPGNIIIIKYEVQRYQSIAPPDGNFGVMLKNESGQRRGASIFLVR